MNNYDYRFSKKRVPIFFFLLYLFFTFFGINLFFKNKSTLTSSSISQAKTPKIKQMKFINATHNNISIFWQSEEKISSWIIYGEKKDKLIDKVFDEKDLNYNLQSYYNHFFNIKNLKPNSDYYFIIVTPKGMIKNKENQPFEFRTKKNPPQPNNNKPLTGIIQRKDNNFAQDNLILMEIEGADPLGSLIKESGEWTISLYYLTKKNSDDFYLPKEDDLVKIVIYYGKKEETEIKTLFKFLDSLPKEIILGRKYDFLDKNNENILGKKVAGKNFKKNDLAIIFPKDDAVIPGKKPLIKGTALPNRKIKVFFNSPLQIYEIYSDNEGIWQISPFYDLSVGKNTVKIKTVNEKGEEVEMKRDFTILKSGESVLGEATPSAVISQTLIISPSPTTIIVSPTSTFSPTPYTSENSSFLTPTTSYSPPVSGVDESLIFLMGGILTTLGFLLIFIF